MENEKQTHAESNAPALSVVAGSEKKLPRWVKVQRVFLWGPRRMKDSQRLRWLRHAWEIEDSAMEYFMGLLPEYEYFETEAAAWADLFPNNEISRRSPERSLNQ